MEGTGPFRLRVLFMGDLPVRHSRTGSIGRPSNVENWTKTVLQASLPPPRKLSQKILPYKRFIVQIVENAGGFLERVHIDSNGHTMVNYSQTV